MIPQVEASIKEAVAEKATLEADIKQAQADREAAKAAMAEATALREKEAAAFAKESGDLKTNIAALTKAVAALEKGMAGAFLQTSMASVIRRLTISMDIGENDRDVLSSFLSTHQGEEAEYAPQSGEIVGILKQMLDTMEKDLAETIATEETAGKTYEEMMAAKTKEINALTSAIEEKLVRVGEVGVEIVNMKEDLDDTQKSLLEDKGFLADLDKNCETRKKEYEVVVETRSEELVAIADTIKILNDDDALELFKKTLPSASLLQTKVANKEVKNQALQALQKARGVGKVRDYRLEFIATALHAGKVDFSKVIKMIDDMVALLAKEQVDDDEKKAYCETELDKSEDELKEMEHKIEDLEKALEEAKTQIETLASEIEALTDGIKALDKSVAEATEQRKEDHEEFVEAMAADTAAKDIIGIAKNRLNKFYNPKLYKAPPKRELTEEERIATNMGGTLAPTEAPGGIAGTGVTVLEQEAPPPPPEAVPAYAKKGQKSSGVLAMLDMMVADLDKEMQEMEVEEKDSQAEYEEFVKVSAEKRAADSKSIEEKESAKAGLESDIVDMEAEKKATMKEAMAKGEYIADLHAECDWLVQNYDIRKEARAGEVDALKKAKAVLSGADFSLIQVARGNLRSMRRA